MIFFSLLAAYFLYERSTNPKYWANNDDLDDYD